MRQLGWAIVLLVSCGGPAANLQSQDPYERYLGVKQLALERGAAGLPEIVRRLDDPKYLVVLGALEALAEIGEPESLQHVPPKLRHDHPLVRQQACATVGALKNPEGIPALVEALKDREPSVRREAVKALARFGRRPEVVEALLEALGDAEASVVLMAHTQLEGLTGKSVATRSRKDWSKTLESP